MTRALALAAAVGISLLTTHAGTASWQQGSGSAPTDACSLVALQPRAPADTTLTAAAWVDATATAPRHCVVEGTVRTPGNRVRFRVGLPAVWNGKFYFQGIGGLGGTIGNLTTGLARGYASASTDTGHDAADGTWGADRAKEIDYGHRGTHVTAVAAKAITAGYYGKPAAHAYFNGCSNGGRQALMEVQRYPNDFDGVIAGDPATGTPMQAGRAVLFQQMLASPANYLPQAKVELLSARTLAACDATDGLADGLVSDPRTCAFDPAVLQCTGAEDGPACLTAGQVATVRAIYAGLKDPAGKEYAPPFPPGHEGGASGWAGWITGTEPPTPQADGTLAFGAKAPSGYSLMDANFRFLALDEDAPGFSWRAFRFPADLPRLATMTQILSPLDPDLRPFAATGGKLLVYHGWADPGISALGTLHYVETATRTAGGQAAADRFLRTYFVPGMHHCSGGPGVDRFDMLTELERWVEQGQAPTRVIASRVVDGAVVRSRPLCPHPQTAAYSGTGSIDDAARFVCLVPASSR